MVTKVLFDFNNVAMRTLHLPQVGILGRNPSFEFWDYLVFTNIYEFISTVAAETGDKVETYLVLDGRGGYWRREIYENYKADRVEKRGRDNIDWEAVYANFDKFLGSVEKYIPWYITKVPKCEADDVIAVLAAEDNESNIIIHSTDSDYVQCLKENVKLYNPNHGYITIPGVVKVASDKIHCESVEEFLLYSIMTGQAGKDNVFNIKTASDWQPTDEAKRRPPFGPKTSQKLWNKLGKDYDKLNDWLQENSLQENFERNKALIDLSTIPESYKQQIREAIASSVFQNKNVDISGFLSEREWPSLSDFSVKSELSDCLAIMAGVGQEEIIEEEVSMDNIGAYAITDGSEDDFVL